MKKARILLCAMFFIIPIFFQIDNSYVVNSHSFEDQLPETILAITQLIAYPEVVYVGELVFVNCTVENNGQFQTAEIVGIKINATVKLSEKEIVLGESIEPGGYEHVSFNLTAISKGVGNITVIVSTENAPTVSKSILISILENTSTTDYGFHSIFLLLPIIIAVRKTSNQNVRKKRILKKSQ